ncbi:MAG TPA: DUF6265 family protein [Sphingorhabdus sp.]|nr:DUF6265 family protein [Sphingorhabdus sp.]
MKHFFALAALLAGIASSPAIAQDASLADLAFLEGHWTSDRSGFVIEESWTDARAGVVLGTSRGVQDDVVRFLRFAVVEQAGKNVVMRFKRYNADYSSWEASGPSVMRLVTSEPNRAVFEATDVASDVQRITYTARSDGAVDVVANRVDADGPYLVEFTLRRS